MNHGFFSNVANCAFQRWAQLIMSTNTEDRLRAEEEKKTAYMALDLCKTRSKTST